MVAPREARFYSALMLGLIRFIIRLYQCTVSPVLRLLCGDCGCRGGNCQRGPFRTLAEALMDLDPILLSRLQFAWVIGWHILMPAFTVGMASYIAILEGLHLVTGRDQRAGRRERAPLVSVRDENSHGCANLS